MCHAPTIWWTIAALCSSLGLIGISTLPAEAQATWERRQIMPLIEERIKIPSSVPGVFGTRSYILDGLVIRPQVDERLPLAIITHGTPREAADRRKMEIMWFARIARDFARRGWVAAVVMRRGHGVSEGEYAEGMTCGNPDYIHSGRIAVYDLTSATRFLSEQPYVDPDRVLGVGHSTGGFGWLATSANPPTNLVAVLNLAGGHGSVRPFENCSESQMILAMREFGGTSRIPSLWVYSENDGYTVPDFASRMHRAFVAAGGRADLKIVPGFESDGHDLFLRPLGAHLWMPLADSFLRSHGLPTWAPSDSHPELLPSIAALRERYARYLTASVEKVFAISLNGDYDWWQGARDRIETVKQEAMSKCEGGVRKCRVFAINFAVVPPSGR